VAAEMGHIQASSFGQLDSMSHFSLDLYLDTKRSSVVVGMRQDAILLPFSSPELLQFFCNS